MRPMTVAVVLTFACSGGESGTGDDDDASTQEVPADAAPAEPDATVLAYPAGPYGMQVGDTIANLVWQGYIDTDADEDDDAFNEPPREVSMEDFFIGRDPSSRMLLTDVSAGWCGPCLEEAAQMPAREAQYGPRGIRFLTALIDQEDGSPADTAYCVQWAASFGISTPIVADPPPGKLIGYDPYGGALPSFMLVDTTTMKIVAFPWDWAEIQPILEMYAE